MHIPKRYGESRIESCPFCGRQAIIKNSQGISVCMTHKAQKLPEMKCSCGENLLIQEGKFGIFFSCPNCGNVSIKRAVEMNSKAVEDSSRAIEIKTPQKIHRTIRRKRIFRAKHKIRKKKMPSHIIVRSDDPRYFR
jgi:predicted RNA-binding Zn-ribbon protein involved in translation (DUF1610 family)